MSISPDDFQDGIKSEALVNMLATERVRRLEGALEDILRITGPVPCSCGECVRSPGMQEDVGEVIRIALEALS